MQVQRRIEHKLQEAFLPSHLEVANESSQHNVPPGSESHFRLLVVSDAFHGRSRVQRHQAVYRALADELGGPVHALGLQTLTPQEWEAERSQLESPPCLGGDGS